MCPQALLASLAGTWTGTWTETQFPGPTGSMNITITESAGTIDATGTIGPTSLGKGTPSGTATGTVSGNTLTFTFSSPAVTGSGQGTIVIDQVSGSGTIKTYGDFTFSATVAGDTINGTYDFTGGGAGNVTLTRQ